LRKCCLSSIDNASRGEFAERTPSGIELESVGINIALAQLQASCKRTAMLQKTPISAAQTKNNEVYLGADPHHHNLNPNPNLKQISPRIRISLLKPLPPPQPPSFALQTWHKHAAECKEIGGILSELLSFF
jgi:hypothetical protein